MIPYIDPKIFSVQRDNQRQTYLLNEKGDIYSIGILLWEISSGNPPFREENYDLSLMYKISQGRREEIISHTPNDYSNLYTGKFYYTILFNILSVSVFLIKYVFLIIRMLEWGTK